MYSYSRASSRGTQPDELSRDDFSVGGHRGQGGGEVGRSQMQGKDHDRELAS